MRKNATLLFIVIFVAAVAAGFFVYPKFIGSNILPWRLGLDLVGGTQLTYDIDLTSVASQDRSAVLDGLRDIMERRVNFFGVSEPQVMIAKSGSAYRIIVELAGIRDVATAIQQIGRTARLEFKEVETIKPAKEGEQPSVNYRDTALTGRYLTKAQVVTNQTTYQPEIAIEFNADGAKIFEDLTSRNIGKPLAIFLDDAPISAPVVRDKISGGRAVISGQFTFAEAKNLAGLLNAGALPAPVKLVNQQTVGASLGLDSLRRTLFAGLIGTLAVMIFMIIYYGLFGLFASLALLVYIIFTLTVFKGFAMTMSLSSIAGFILSIGMAVDANILIFERTKEEIRKGISRLSAIEEGFRRAWPSIRDSNISTIITSAILYYFTTSFVRGFALALLIGVLVSMFSAITVTRTLLRVFIKQ